jgi:hypothetical protein
MSEAILMEYMGFTSTTEGREYAFHVRFSSQDSRDYTVTIATQAFASRRVSYQDGPNICSSRLKRELTTNPDGSTGTSFLIDEKEIDSYKLRHMPEGPKRRHGQKLPTPD